MSHCLTPEDVRFYIMDRNIADNDLLLDLNFSEEEIRNAMVRAAREYASIPPLVDTVCPDCLPMDTNLFLDGTAAQLYVSELSKLMRNDIEYTSGGVTTNLVSNRIKHLKELIKLHQERFVTTATTLKMTTNIHSAFWHY